MPTVESSSGDEYETGYQFRNWCAETGGEYFTETGDQGARKDIVNEVCELGGNDRVVVSHSEIGSNDERKVTVLADDAPPVTVSLAGDDDGYGASFSEPGRITDRDKFEVKL